jgi:hypothetical protein
MKKQVIAALVLVAAAIGATTPSWAFTSQLKKVVTAGTFVGGTRAALFTLNVRTVNTTQNLPVGSSVTWSGVTAGQSWTLADRFLVLNSTVSDLNGGIQIYTDNTSATANPKFNLPAPSQPINASNSAGGLVRGDGAQVLPMAWSIKSTAKVANGTDAATGIGAADPNSPTGTGANNPFQWLFVTDKGNTAGLDFNGDGDVTDAGDSAPFLNGAAYITPIRNGGALEVLQDGTLESSANTGNGRDSFMYFEANFAQAAPQTLYQTTTLTVEAFIQ